MLKGQTQKKTRTFLLQQEGTLLQKYRNRNWRCMAILFKSIGVRGRFDSPEPLLAGRKGGAETSVGHWPVLLPARPFLPALFCISPDLDFVPAPNLDGPNRQSPIASVQRTRSTLAGHSAGPRGTNTTPTNANRAIRIAVQRTQGLRGPNSLFLGGDMTANER